MWLEILLWIQDAEDVIRPLAEIHPLLGVIAVIGIAVVTYLVVENYRIRKAWALERDARIDDMKESVAVNKSLNDALTKWVDEGAERATWRVRIENSLDALAKQGG